MFCFRDCNRFRKSFDEQCGVFTFYNGHKVRAPVLIEYLDYHSLEISPSRQPHQKRRVLTLKLYVTNDGSSPSLASTCRSTDGIKNLCLRVSSQYSNISSLCTFAFTANIGGKSGVATKRLESNILTCLQLEHVALWLIFLRTDACSTEAKSLSGPPWKDA
jgi:hypothetical protein